MGGKALRTRISLVGLLAAAATSNTLVAWALGIEGLVEGLVGLAHPGPYPPSLVDVERDFLVQMLLGPLAAIMFGIIGAMIFLGPAFLIVARTKGPQSFVIAGVLASLAWIACGLCARLLPEKSPPSWFDWAAFALCLEPFGFRSVAAITAALGALVAGPVAGWAYWWALNAKDGSRHVPIRPSSR